MTPGSVAGDAVVSWTAGAPLSWTAGAPLSRPLLRWAAAATDDGRALAGAVVEVPAAASRIDRSAYWPATG